MNETFINYASEILGDTYKGLSGSKIVKYCNYFAVKHNIKLPYSTYPFPKGTPNKRYALNKNLMKFTKDGIYELINYMCDLPTIKENDDVKKLKTTLISKYSVYSSSKVKESELIQETRHWLENYPESLKLYNDALNKYENDIFERNSLDDMRLSFELLLKNILENNKSLENQSQYIGKELKKINVSQEIRNLNDKVIDYYSKYQNTYIKHNDNVNKSEIEYIIELTSSMMKFIISTIG